MLTNSNSAVLFVTMVVIICFLVPVSSLQSEFNNTRNDKQSATSSLTSSRSVTSRTIPDEIVEYLIITPSAFVDEYELLWEWKTKKGVPAKIVTIEDIDGSYNIEPDIGAEIQQYIADFNVKSGYNLTWVLLGADSEYIPARSIYTEASETLIYGEDYYPTDYYYSGLSRDWDSNDDGVFGEVNDSKSLYEVDYDPKCFVGRLPADTIDHVKNYVEILIEYEQSPISDGWLSSALLVDAVFDPPNVFDNYSTPKVDEGYGYWEDNGREATNNIKYHIEDDFNITHLYDYDQFDGGNYSPEKDILDQDSFVNEVNEGHGIVNVVSHSFLSGNGTVSYEGAGTLETWRRFFYYTDAENMYNGKKRSFMYFSDCDVLNFTETDDSNFETLFTNPQGGAVAVIGPTGSTYRGESTEGISRGNWWLANHFWYLFNDGFIRPGEAMYRTKWDYYLYCLDDLKLPYDWPSLNVNMVSYNLLGDPEVPIWPGEPKGLQVSIPKLYVDSDKLQLTVNNNLTMEPIEDALICIWGDNNKYLRYNTASNGTISVASEFDSSGVYDITITKDGYIPYIGELKIHPEPSDLTILSEDDVAIDFGSGPALVNTEGNISVKISNIGTTSPLNTFKVNFTDHYSYRGLDHIDYIGDKEITKILADSDVQIEIDWTPELPGEHDIQIIIDPDNDVDEYNETNNIFITEQTISGPDLRLISSDIKISPEGIPSVGESITINASILNSDWGSVESFLVSFYRGNPDADGALLKNKTYVGTLNKNEKATVGITTGPLSAGGEHTYYVVVDGDNSIIESNELNNMAFISFYVNHPPAFSGISTIKIDEDTSLTDIIDLLDKNLTSDEDNSTSELQLQVINISDSACGFSLENSRYVHVDPESNWFGSAVVNLSLSDGIKTVYFKLDIEVESENDAPDILSLSLESYEMREGEDLILNLQISDIDDKLLTVEISSLTDLFLTQKFSLEFYKTLDTGTANWDGSGKLVFKYNLVDSDPIEHSLFIKVSDGEDSVSEQISFNLTAEEKAEEQPTILGMEEGMGIFVLAGIGIIIILILIIMIIVIIRRQGPSEIEEEKSKDEVEESEEEESKEETEEEALE